MKDKRPSGTPEERERLFEREIEPLLTRLNSLCEKHGFPLAALCEIAEDPHKGVLVGGSLWVPDWATKRLHLFASIVENRIEVYPLDKKPGAVSPVKIVD